VLVVDNASRDDTVDDVKHQFPDVKLIANEENLGFAAANNQGLELSTGRYIFFLNPDTIMKPGSLDLLIDFMDTNPDAGACGPKLLFEDGTVQNTVRRFPSFRGALYRHTIFKSLGLFKAAYNKWLMKDFTYDRPLDVDQIIGAALMVSRDVLDKTGPMDEKNFFMYYEEVDLCFRIKKTGRRIVFLPQPEIIHLAGQSSGQIPAEKTIMAMTSLLKFFKKHRSPVSSVLYRWLFRTAFVAQEIAALLLYGIAYSFGFICLSRRIKSSSKKKLIYSGRLLKCTWDKGLG
jgi:GT2 family glycosyltransferase